MNVYERAKDLPKSDLMQYAAAEKESVVDVQDLPENISTQVGTKSDVKLDNDALEQNVELAGQQTEILGKHTDILQSQSKQLAQLNETMGSLYAMWHKEFNRIEPKIDNRDRTPPQKLVVEQPKQQADVGSNLGSLISDLLDLGGRGKRGRPGRGGKGRPGRGGKGRPGRFGRMPRIPGGIASAGRGLLSTVGRFAGPVGALAGAGMVGWEIGTALNKYVIDPGVSWATGGKSQSLGTWIYDKIHGDEDLSLAIPQTQGKGAQYDKIAKNAASKDFGSVSAHFESGGRGVHTVSTGKGDHGGVSYGKHQLSSKSGTMRAFLNSEFGAPYKEHFRGLMPGTAAFSNRYKEVAQSNPGTFEQAQQQFMIATHFSPMAQFIKRELGLDVRERSRAIQEVIYSVATQYGAGGLGKKFVLEALSGVNLQTATDEQIIQKIQDYRAASVNKFFASSDAGTRASVARRAGQEKEVLLRMLEGEKAVAAQKQNTPTEVASTETSTPSSQPESKSETTTATAQQPTDVQTPTPTNEIAQTPAVKEETKTESVAPIPETKPSTPEVQVVAAKQETPVPAQPVAQTQTPSSAPQNSFAAPKQKTAQILPFQSPDVRTVTPQMPQMPTPNVSVNSLASNLATPTAVQKPDYSQNAVSAPVTKEYFTNSEHTISTAPATQPSKVQAVNEPVVRQEFTDVQKVMAVNEPVVNQPVVQGAAPQQQGSSKESQKLSEFPTFMDDFGLIFVTSGWV